MSVTLDVPVVHCHRPLDSAGEIIHVTYCLLIAIAGWGWYEPDPAVAGPAAVTTATSAEQNLDWPQFRGPGGQGHGVAGKLPTKWSEVTNIAWKTDLPGAGWSSPVIHSGAIWLTAALNEGRTLKLLKIDQETGQLTGEFTIFQVATPGKVHPKNGHASPTPVIENNRIYIHFGAHGTACADLQGKILWKTVLNYYHHHGPAASPIVVGQRLIISCDGFDKSFYDGETKTGVTDFQFVVALSIETGEIDWKKSRQGRHSYATPLLIEVDGQQQIISPGGDRVTAYQPETGAEIWSVKYTGYSVIPRPVFGQGLLFICTGYDSAQLMAIRPNGQGDVTDTHVVWTIKQGIPFTPSPIWADGQLYLVNDSGIGMCLDAESGKMLWKRRFGGNFSASPILADNKLFFVAEEGTTHILEPGKQYKRLAMSRINGTTFASPAVSGTAIYLRSDKSLYRIEERSKSPTRPKSSGLKSKTETKQSDAK